MGLAASRDIVALEILPPTRNIFSPSRIGFSLASLPDLVAKPFTNFVISSLKVCLCTSLLILRLALLRSSCMILFSMSDDCGFLLFSSIHRTNFCSHATFRRHVSHSEVLLIRSSKFLVCLISVAYTSFFISSDVSGRSCSLVTGYSSSGCWRKTGYFSHLLFCRKLSISSPVLASSAGFRRPGQCLH